ncbi:MAG: hypothetical protein NTU43_12425 [Bacteroidetes bacterium]|nr:hypothetical protein [Bacteroidota bacterium]
MKTKLLYFSIISLLFIMQACKPNNPCEEIDPSDKVYTYNIPDSNKTKIPYTGTETLVFISNTGDTATLVGQGKDEYYVNIKNLRNGGGDCPLYSVRNYQKVEMKFVSDISSLSNIIYKVYMPSNLEEPGFTYIEVDVNNKYLVQRSYEYLCSQNNPHDSIMINNIYRSGYYFNDINSKTLLYGNSYGILNFKYNNQTWKLYNKK